jgi:hypothetical protein
MEPSKLVRLNCLFEKAVANNAQLLEKRELDELYDEFINDGRDKKSNNMVIFSRTGRRTVG